MDTSRDTVTAIRGPLSYQVCTSEDVLWYPHTDQLLASKSPTPELTPQVLPSYWSARPLLRVHQPCTERTTVRTGFPRPPWRCKQHCHHPPWRIIPAGTPLASNGHQIAWIYNPGNVILSVFNALLILVRFC